MKRKVVQQGPATLMISLPKDWVDENSVKKGQEMNIEPDGKRLIISPDFVKPIKKKADMTITTVSYTRSMIWKYYMYKNYI